MRKVERRVTGSLCSRLRAHPDRSYDLAFLDIDKEDYAPALEQCRRVLRSGGLLLSDNTSFSQAGEFNSAVYRDPSWQSVQLLSYLPGHSPEKDGICLAVKVE